MITAPRRSAEQRREALDHANRVRYQRAELKRVLKREPWIAQHCIDQPAPWLETMRVSDLVCALPKQGPLRASRLLRRCGVPWEKRIGSLTDRQRDALTHALEETS